MAPCPSSSALVTDGGKRPKAELVESFSNPVAKIVPGYSLVSITMKDSPVWMMPPMLWILTPREVRDVVAYLSSMKPTKSKAASTDEHRSIKAPYRGECDLAEERFSPVRLLRRRSFQEIV